MRREGGCEEGGRGLEGREAAGGRKEGRGGLASKGRGGRLKEAESGYGGGGGVTADIIVCTDDGWTTGV